MNNEWVIDLKSQRELRNLYLSQGKKSYAESVSHTSSVYEGKTILLFTGEELASIQKSYPEKVLISIFGEEITASNCDSDTRFGYVAYGVLK